MPMPSLYSRSLGQATFIYLNQRIRYFGITLYNTIFFYKKQARLPFSYSSLLVSCLPLYLLTLPRCGPISYKFISVSSSFFLAASSKKSLSERLWISHSGIIFIFYLPFGFLSDLTFSKIFDIIYMY